MAAKVQAKPSAGLTKRRAKIVCDEIGALCEERKRVTPRALLDRAASESSPLHSFFEWDDSVAGKKWRLEQARELIASVEIIVVEVDHPVRMMHSVVVNTERGASTREFVHRDVVLKSNEKLAGISADRYAQVRALVIGAQDLGLHKFDSAWSAIARAVLNNVPAAARERG